MPPTIVLVDLTVDVLVPAGLSLVLGTNLFADLMPDSPDIATCVYGYGGEAPEFTFGPSNLPTFSRPHIQVCHRNTDSMAGLTFLESVVRALETANATINGSLYERIERIQEPFMSHRDAARRTYRKCNLAVTLTPT